MNAFEEKEEEMRRDSGVEEGTKHAIVKSIVKSQWKKNLSIFQSPMHTIARLCCAFLKCFLMSLLAVPKQPS